MTSSSTDTSPSMVMAPKTACGPVSAATVSCTRVVGRARALDDAHAAVREAVIAQLGHHHVVRREDEPLIARLARRDRQPCLEALEMVGGNAVEPVEDDLLDDRRLAFVDLNGDGDLVLRVVQLDIDADDLRSGIAAIGVERLDALDVAIELRAIEKLLARPRQESALARGENGLQLAGRHGVGAANLIDVTCTSPVSRHEAADTAMSRIVARSRRITITRRGSASSFRALLRGAGRARFADSRASCRFLILREALAEALHEVDDLAFGRRLGRRQPRLLSLDARLDQLHQIVAVLVGVLGRIPLGREVLDQHLRHVELGLAHLLARRKFQLRGVDQLVGISQHRQHQRIVDHLERREVLRLANDDLGDADAARIP